MDCEILIAGGGVGGVAAAIAAAEAGATVCLLESGNWLGGQFSSQGVCTPDEQQHIEHFGGTLRYMTFRKRVRDYYRTTFVLSPEAQNDPYLNPGSCWVSRLSFEPRIGADILLSMTESLRASGRLQVHFGAEVVRCVVGADGPDNLTVQEVGVETVAGGQFTIRPKFVLDATDLGDLLPLCGQQGVDWVVGAESKDETGEPDAPAEARTDWVQPFTFPFAVDWSPQTAATNVIKPPEEFEELCKLQRYHVKHGAITGLFAGAMPWWRYRRIAALSNFNDPAVPADIAMINTAGNDYYGGNIIGTTADGAPVSSTQAAETQAHARRASLGYLYWLQTECIREPGDLAATPYPPPIDFRPGEKGYPELRLRAHLFDTEDGLAPKPYIRESRRIKSLRPITQQEIVVKDFKGGVCRGDNARAAYMHDSVGIGHYALDIHPNGHGEPNYYVPTRPFQIPFGSLIPTRLTNLLPAAKNLGVTHLTNGAYRLHPIEWNIGESAGLLAAWCLAKGCSPRDLCGEQALREQFQMHLVAQGIALHWYIDVPIGHPAFATVQWLCGRVENPGSRRDLLFRPDDLIELEDWSSWQRECGVSSEELPPGSTRAHAAMELNLRALGPG